MSFLDAFLNGNEDFIANSENEQQVKETASGQKPIALVVSCSDSRVGPEIVFNQPELGKFFVIRTPGGMVDVKQVKTLLGLAPTVNEIIVIGHTDCGAMKLALQNGTNKLTRIVKQMSIESEAELATVMTKLNVVDQILSIKSQVKNLPVIGILYDTQTGKASRLEDGEVSDLSKRLQAISSNFLMRVLSHSRTKGVAVVVFISALALLVGGILGLVAIGTLISSILVAVGATLAVGSGIGFFATKHLPTAPENKTQEETRVRL